ncbi:MAG: cell division protein BolA [SAR86 cluster bacterium]|uniref:Cell division protein BolA n=1 Tax=SAR86 cluster bacterium TaxID=2030880 RepID=A0A2A5B0G0_9GAMM|nr:MAG: cell division protein BolA [SAR86 cluster bacterium]
MEASLITDILTNEFSDCSISVEGGDGKYLVTAVGDVFEGLNAVRRQQAIYKVLNEHIKSGAIHAVTMKLMTNTENSTS